MTTNGNTPQTTPTHPEMLSDIPQGNPHKSRKVWAGKLVSAVALMAAVGVLYLAYTGRQKSPEALQGLQPMPGQPGMTQQGQQQTPMTPGQDPNVGRRDAALNNAIVSSTGDVGELICARANFFRQEANENLQNSSVPLEESLMGKVKQYAIDGKRNVVQYNGLTGNNRDFPLALENVINYQAALMAYNGHVKNEPLKMCIVNQAQTVQDTQQLVEEYAIVRQRSIEAQVNRSQSIERGGQPQ